MSAEMGGNLSMRVCADVHAYKFRRAARQALIIARNITLIGSLVINRDRLEGVLR
jgi:hypothetical protein